MALAFFRRRQKMVVIIMAVLMVSFLVGYQGLSMLMSGKRSENVFGRAATGEVTQTDLLAARAELEHLDRLVGVGSSFRRPAGELSEAMLEADTEIHMLRRNGDQTPLAYALLLQEADEAGISVAEGEIDALLRLLGLTGDQYANRISEVRENPGITEIHFRATVARWLKVRKMFDQAAPRTPPSRSEVMRLYRDLSEGMNLRVLAVDAESLLDEMPETFSDAEIAEHFKRYRGAVAGRYASTETFGFGYVQPSRVSVVYLMIDRQAVARAMRPMDKAVRSHFRDNAARYVKDVPITPSTQPTAAPATQPTTQPTTAPASEPVEYRTVAMDLAEAMPQIRRELAEEDADEKMGQLVDHAVGILRNLDRADKPGLLPYRAVYKRMIRHDEAQAALARSIKVSVKALPLDQAMEKLAKAADLVAICYPWGKHGDFEISKDVQVTLGAEAMTLRAALDEITRQVFPAPPSDSPAPTLKWAMCAALDRTLMPLGGAIEMFPVKVVRTGLLTAQQFKDDPIVGLAATARRGGRPLGSVAFSARKFRADKDSSSGMEVDDDGPRMFVGGPRPGMLLWRLKQAVPAHRPERITPQLRSRIIADLRIRAAYDKAVALARELALAAKDKGLEAAAAEAKLDTVETGMFSRRVYGDLRREGMLRIAQLSVLRSDRPRQNKEELFMQLSSLHVVQLADFIRRSLRPEIWRQAITDQPSVIAWSRRVGGVDLPAQYAEAFMTKAFSLTPADVDNPNADPAPALAVFPLPARRQVLVIQRIGYRPAPADGFEQAGRAAVSRAIMDLRRWRAMSRWYNISEIKSRLDFVMQSQ